MTEKKQKKGEQEKPLTWLEKRAVKTAAKKARKKNKKIFKQKEKGILNEKKEREELIAAILGLGSAFTILDNNDKEIGKKELEAMEIEELIDTMEKGITALEEMVEE